MPAPNNLHRGLTREHSSTPRSGAYHSPSKVSSSKTFAFGGRPAGPPPGNVSTPGPGQYNLDDNPGNVVRNGKNVTTAAKSKMASHSFTSKPKPRAKVGEDGPGPGAYYTQHSVASPRPGSVGGTGAFGPRSPRFAVKTDDHPGPGAYLKVEGVKKTNSPATKVCPMRVPRNAAIPPPH